MPSAAVLNACNRVVSASALPPAAPLCLSPGRLLAECTIVSGVFLGLLHFLRSVAVHAFPYCTIVGAEVVVTNCTVLVRRLRLRVYILPPSCVLPHSVLYLFPFAASRLPRLYLPMSLAPPPPPSAASSLCWIRELVLGRSVHLLCTIAVEVDPRI